MLLFPLELSFIGVPLKVQIGLAKIDLLAFEAHTLVTFTCAYTLIFVRVNELQM